MGIIQIGVISFVILSVIGSITYILSSAKESGVTEQKIIQYQEIIREKEKNEEISTSPSSTVDELLIWLREHEE